MKHFLAAVAALLAFAPCSAQRFMDRLDRGVVAVKAAGGNLVTWRVKGEEYFDVAYNVYRDGTLLTSAPVSVGNYLDAAGSTTSTYTVAAVVKGHEQPQSKAAKVLPNNWLEIPAATRISNDGHTDITADYEPNDATIADVDGDGEMEILVKQINIKDQNSTFSRASIDWDRIEVYKLDGTLLWWIDCGPNMCDFQHNETNIAAYDWDMDGRAECILRGADGMTVHCADGTTIHVGDNTKNYRPANWGTMAEKFVHEGDEFLLYLNGATGAKYQLLPYPLKRLEAGETDLNRAWGDGYGHRSSKHFFGAPYLDGKHPSVFLARGIYTRHKMIAYDVDPATHALNQRWQWVNNTPGSPWYGQGYHNYSIADVDWDGRDEICFGSMVIDDNGHGLSTTGLGHGDSQHVSDFDPYRHGQEIAACNEDRPANNYRDATTSKIYYRLTGDSDAGRCLAGNFSDLWPGAQFCAAHDSESLISLSADKHIASATQSGVTQNFRIYWDGDLCEESFDYVGGKNSAGGIFKYGKGRIATLTGSATNNDTKGTPCFQGDIFGDWREEVIMRVAGSTAMRVYTTDIETTHRITTLLHDPQYRNAMVHQMNGYNQAPHTSYFLGELEGITTPTPAPTTTGKTVVAAGGTIDASLAGKDVLLDATADAAYTVAAGAAPASLTVNAPTWVQGHDDNDNITTTVYTHTLAGGALTGDMRLVKLGDGTLVLPDATHTYTGDTKVWGGTLACDGTLAGSRVELSRFATLAGHGNFPQGIAAEYGATVDPDGAITAGAVGLGFGSAVKFDITPAGCDNITASSLTIEKKQWSADAAPYAPKYDSPRFVFNIDPAVQPGTYTLMNVQTLTGSLDDIVIEGCNDRPLSLAYDQATATLTVTIAALRPAASVVWTGAASNVWDFADQQNFSLGGQADIFAAGDNVTFNDQSAVTDVVLKGTIAPAAVNIAAATNNYTFSGAAITGTGVALTKSGDAKATLASVSDFKGTVAINGGTLAVATLGQKDGVNTGALGDYQNAVTINGGTLATTAPITTSHPITVGTAGATIDCAAPLTLDATLAGTGALTKTGTAALVLAPKTTVSKVIVSKGTLQTNETFPKDIVLQQGTTLRDRDDIYSYTTSAANVEIAGTGVNWYADSRCTYKGALSGTGSATLYIPSIRADFQGSWAAFEGKLTIKGNKTGSYDPILELNGNTNMARATVTFNLKTDNKGKNVKVGDLKGTAELAGSGIWEIGALGNNISGFTGTFSGGKITKTGTGLWKMTKEQTAVGGATTVNAGTLQLLVGSSATTYYAKEFFGGKGVNVSGTGILNGRAKLNKIDVNAGGTLMPGNSATASRYGDIQATQGIYCYAGSVVNLNISNKPTLSTACSALKAGGTISIKGDLVIELRSGFTPEEGMEYQLLDAATIVYEPTNVTLPTLPAGLAWQNDLATTGKLSVVKATGIAGITDAGRNKATRKYITPQGQIRIGDYNTLGQKVK